MAIKHIEVCLDTISPYSYFALIALARYAPIWHYQLSIRPVFLGGIMKLAENRPPAAIPAKAKYLVQDVKRNAALFACNVSRSPSNFFQVAADLRIQRLLAASYNAYGATDDRLLQICLEIFRMIHAGDRDEKNNVIVTDESLVETLKKAGIAHSEAERLIELSRTTDAKEILKESTKYAFEQGAFGSPLIIVTDNIGRKETFFGSDRFEQIADVFGVEWKGPNPPEARL